MAKNEENKNNKAPIPLVYDNMFKYFIKDYRVRWYVIKVISELINQDENAVERKIQFLDTELTGKPKFKGKRSDVVCKVGHYIINIEMNNWRRSNTYEDKQRYVNFLYNKYYPKDDNQKMKYYIIQVHINNFDDDIKIRNEYRIRDFAGKVLIPKIKIIKFNLVKIKQKWDNGLELSKLEKLLLILKLSENMTRLKKFIEEDEDMTKLEKEKQFFEQIMDEFYTEFDEEEELARTRADEVSTARADGKYEEKRNVARNMIKMALPKETILKATGINAEEYDKLVTT